MKYDVCIVGGAGHVGLPLGVTFANSGVKTVLYDLNESSLEKIATGKFPFKEENGDAELKKALKAKKLHTSTSPETIAQSNVVVLVIGTPVDEHLNPDRRTLFTLIDKYFPYFQDGQTLILRSTVYPGISERVQRYFNKRKKKVNVAFCPERIAQGASLMELRELPQIVSAFDQKTIQQVSKLFKKIAPSVVVTKQPIEAELAKLYSNAWRYIKFSVANQFYMMADQYDLDYRSIYDAMTREYPRNKDLPGPGLAAGPCLFKDTMQLAAFYHNNFFLGHAAMLVNEGMPNYIIQKLKRHNKGKSHRTVGILGMAFKAGSDDHRSSLSYKLRKIAESHADEVLCHDVYIDDPSFHTLEEVLERSQAIILATPHEEYRTIIPTDHPKKAFIDIWNFW